MQASMPTTKTWHIYVHQQKVYIPCVALTDAGFFMDIEPVAVVPLHDEESFAKAVAQAMEAGNPTVRAPNRAEYGEAVVSKAAGTGSWSRFEKGARCHVVYWDDEGYRIPKMTRVSSGGWVESSKVALRLPPSATSSDVARELVRIAHESSNGELTKQKQRRKS